MDFDELIPQGIQPLIIPQKNTYNLSIESDYEYENGDRFYFTIKEQLDNDYTDNDALLAKDWTYGTTCELDNEGNLCLQLAETDTSIDFGQYYYDIKMLTTGSTAATTTAFGKIIIAPVSTLRV